MVYGPPAAQPTGATPHIPPRPSTGADSTPAADGAERPYTLTQSAKRRLRRLRLKNILRAEAAQKQGQAGSDDTSGGGGEAAGLRAAVEAMERRVCALEASAAPSGQAEAAKKKRGMRQGFLGAAAAR